MPDEGMRLLEEYRRKYGAAPTGAELPPMEANTPALAFGALASRGFEAAAPALDPLGHAMGIPARAVGAVGTNLAGLAEPLDVSDVALYGYDVNTGKTASSYGEALAGELESAGEIAEGGRASAIVRAAGDIVSDPLMGPLILTAAEGFGALLGGLGRPAGPVARPPRMPPRGRLHPTSTGMGPGQGPGGGTVVQPPGPTGPVPVRAGPPPRTPPPSTATTPTQRLPPQGPKPPRPGPKAAEQAARTQPVKTIKKPASPEATQKVKVQKRDVEYRKHQRARERRQKKLKRDMGKPKED